MHSELVEAKPWTRHRQILERLFPRFQPSGKTLVMLYTIAAVAVVLFDVGYWVLSSQGLPDSRFVVPLFLLAMTLSLCGIHPPFFELLYTVIFLITAYLGLLQTLVSPTIGIYVLVGVWLVRSWIVPGLLLLVVTEASQIAVSPYPGHPGR